VLVETLAPVENEERGERGSWSDRRHLTADHNDSVKYLPDELPLVPAVTS
jgi:hypothetical protein